MAPHRHQRRPAYSAKPLTLAQGSAIHAQSRRFRTANSARGSPGGTRPAPRRKLNECAGGTRRNRLPSAAHAQSLRSSTAAKPHAQGSARFKHNRGIKRRGRHLYAILLEPVRALNAEVFILLRSLIALKQRYERTKRITLLQCCNYSVDYPHAESYKDTREN